MSHRTCAPYRAAIEAGEGKVGRVVFPGGIRGECRRKTTGRGKKPERKPTDS
jgi:hypothetical protein